MPQRGLLDVASRPIRRSAAAVAASSGSGRPNADGGALFFAHAFLPVRPGFEGAHTNRFWADSATGAVLRAEQWVGPGLPPMTVEFLDAGS